MQQRLRNLRSTSQAGDCSALPKTRPVALQRESYSTVQPEERPGRSLRNVMRDMCGRTSLSCDGCLTLNETSVGHQSQDQFGGPKFSRCLVWEWDLLHLSECFLTDYTQDHICTVPHETQVMYTWSNESMLVVHSVDLILCGIGTITTSALHNVSQIYLCLVWWVCKTIGCEAHPWGRKHYNSAWLEWQANPQDTVVVY